MAKQVHLSLVMATLSQADLIQIREATPEDALQIEEMYRSYQPLGETLGLPPAEPNERGDWLENLRRCENLIACVDGRVAGHVALLATGGAAEIVGFVHQDFRRRGIGTALIQQGIEAARGKGYSYVWLLIAKTNLPAQGLLHKLRFRVAWQDLHEMQFLLPSG